MDYYNDVLEFHKKFGAYRGKKPHIPSDKIRDLRQSLINEEFSELMSALARENLIDISDASADLIYVVLGTCITYGIDLRPIWDEVHRTNMAKEGGGQNSMGKVLKPPGWVAPDIKGLLTKQGMKTNA